MNRLYEWIKEHAMVIGVILAILALIIAITGIPELTWYKDSDEDGYGDPKQRAWSIWQLNGYVENDNDCYDGNKDAKPGQTSFFDKDRGDGFFDYDCNGVAEKEQTATGSCSNGTANQGWEGGVPEPGRSGTWLVDCDRRVSVFPPRVEIVRETVSRIQKGR